MADLTVRIEVFSGYHVKFQLSMCPNLEDYHVNVYVGIVGQWRLLGREYPPQPSGINMDKKHVFCCLHSQRTQ